MKYRMIFMMSVCALLGACAKGELAPTCPNYGQHCYKQPINSWDYYEGAKK